MKKAQHGMEDEDEVRTVRYLTDDRDGYRLNELFIFFGDNGDWYVGVAPQGGGCLDRCVRICTSGGAQTRVPGLGPAIADAFRALVAAGEGHGVSFGLPQHTAAGH